MKIISIADKPGSAIDRLARMIHSRLGHIAFAHFCLHPKDPQPEVLAQIRKAAATADLVDYQYWKSGVVARQQIPELARIPSILTHQNEHNINDDERNHWAWQDMPWSVHVAKNEWQKKQLELKGLKPKLIRHACEFDNFTFVPELTHEPIIGYVGQIKKDKGVRELKAACDKLGYRLLIVGLVSEGMYWEAMDKNNLEYLGHVPDDEIGAVYHRMRALVCNSRDGTESGTLPVLEAMASGIPVISRLVGHVRDLAKDGKNILIHKGAYTDVDGLAKLLHQVVNHDDVADAIREEAWRTVRQYNPAIQAREYEKLYRAVIHPDQPPVSVIMPTYNRAATLAENLAKLDEQYYQNFEVVICDDGSTDNTLAVIDEARQLYRYPIRYVSTGSVPGPDGAKAYGLAKARNLGIIEATGDILVFCDDRQAMHTMAIEEFVKELLKRAAAKEYKVWCWGSKGAYKSFVENFSAAWRQQIINGGSFNERIDKYGGTTQEVSNRFGSQGFTFVFVPTAASTPIFNTHSKSAHRQDIIDMKLRLYKMGYK